MMRDDNRGEETESVAQMENSMAALQRMMRRFKAGVYRDGVFREENDQHQSQGQINIASVNPVSDIYVEDGIDLISAHSHTTSITGSHTGPRSHDVETVGFHSAVPQRKKGCRWMYTLVAAAILLGSILVLLVGLKKMAIEGPPQIVSSPILNDRCVDATWLDPNDEPYPATTVGAKIEDDGVVKNCGLGIRSGPGVWFKVFGTGNPMKIVRDDDQAFTNQMSIYQGKCGELTCVTGDDMKGSSLWSTMVGDTYYIRVSGVDDEVGHFRIRLEDISGADDDVAFNDLCEGSIGLPTDGSVYSGTTETATFDLDGAGSCYKTMDAGPGVWYNVLGTGGPLIASTNSREASLVVFSGECDHLACIAASDTSSEVDPVVQWETKIGVHYQILVHNAGGENPGPFDVSVTTSIEDDHYNINDFCKGAIGPVATDGSILRGSTEYATRDKDGAGTCYPESMMGDGVWYTIHGTGKTLGVSATAESSMKPLVAIFSGSCRSLTCIGGAHNDIDVEGREVLSWQTEEKKVYYMLVRGRDKTRGTFELIVESLDSHDEQSTEEPTEVPIDVTIDEPTEPATEQPTEESTASSTTEKPTEEPTEGNKNETLGPITPTVEVEFSLQRPANDFCDSATKIPTVGYTISESTENATTYMDGIGQCHSQKGVGPGLWYVIEGTGKNLTASITDNSVLNAFISVYSGDCESLFCVGDRNGDNRPKRSFTWETTEGVSYYMLVQGIFGQTGQFELALGEAAEQEVTVANDLCQGALGPIPSNGTMWSGSTVGATMDSDGAGLCYAGNMTGIGVWYTAQGTGDKLKIMIKGNSGFAVSAAVFGGFGCASLQCVGSGDAPQNKAGILEWDSIKNVPYFILVHGIGPAVGSFELVIVQGATAAPVEETAEIDVITSNDRCEGAEGPLSSEGTNIYATTETSLVVQEVKAGPCSNAEGGGRGLWYSLYGSGTVIKATTFEFSATADVSISVFSGACDDLACVDGTAGIQVFTQQAEEEKSVYWQSEADQLYYIYVHSPRDATGSFELTLQHADAIPPKNDACDNAFSAIAANGTSVKGSTVGASVDATNAGNCLGQTGVGPGVWYHIAGDGMTHTLERVDLFPTHMTAISVYRGSCKDLVCVTGGPSGQISWPTVNGQDYFILVRSSTTQTGDFEIKVEKSVPTVPPTPQPTMPPTLPPEPQWLNNDECTNAIGPLPSGSRKFGNFALATADPVGACGGSNNANPGVWFSFTGTGAGVRISTCKSFTMGEYVIGEQPAHTSVSIFRQGCNKPQCFIGSNNTCSASGVVNWNTEIGETYHVLVSADGVNASADESYVLMHDDTEWHPRNCIGASAAQLEQLHVLNQVFLASGNLPLSGPLVSKGWLSGCNVCANWDGLACDRNSQVTSIELGTKVSLVPSCLSNCYHRGSNTISRALSTSFQRSCFITPSWRESQSLFARLARAL